MKTAIVLFNLGGPSSPEAVRPFLFNLFNDRAIIGLPQPLRWLVAKIISIRRAPVAAKIYDLMGGSSPLLPNTVAQAEALERHLGPEFKTFVTMRYWHPRASEQIEAIVAWRPDQILLVPLYPQYSTTTTGSSIEEWRRLSDRKDILTPTRQICCWPVLNGFVTAVAVLVQDALKRIPDGMPVRVLFSAHGLPKKVVAAGDPYQDHVERSVAAIVALCPPGLDYQVCYQSRVGPLEWLGPSTDSEITRAGKTNTALVVVPVAFVSEHSETLVELDHEYRHLAEKSGVPVYERVPTASVSDVFIADLAALIRQRALHDKSNGSAELGWRCPSTFSRCGAKGDS